MQLCQQEYWLLSNNNYLINLRAAANDHLGSSFVESFKDPDSSYGGYDYTFVDGDPPGNYICLICTLVSRDPHQVSYCYNIYCKSCLDKHRKKSSMNGTFSCPACRKLLDSRSYFKDGRMEREIKALKVQCIIEEFDWKGTLGDIEAHVMGCPYRMVDCSLGCGEKICCREMETHLRDCPKRIVSCPYCKKEGPHDIITSSAHLDRCYSCPVKCCNEGCEFIEERFWFKHHEKRPKAIVYCGYKMMLCVYANGHGRGKGTHMSCYTVLVPGEYDDELGWPFEGEVTVELLNQLEDKNHLKLII
uniref:RING-type domain-containing protein n=2 Tax=Amphimedon queenslandica TaxID=400682 RepID=A0A1X7T5K6_AMPQE